MAPQDYVKRGQPKRKPKKTKKKTTSNTSGTPWFRMMIALSLVCGFVFALYSLQKETITPPESSQPVSAETEMPAEQPRFVEGPKDPLPILHEEEWAFIDALPEYSVEVDVEEIPDSDKLYIMQCGSFRVNDQAEELRARIALVNLEAEVIESNGSNGRWYRVVLGPYDKKRLAEKHRHELRRNKIVGCKIW
ncbi:SPOR domain-containing protein [Glaciecola sp. 1036]|uniref:SPOR domain-containing protein n=1 Tax=Alteromonadaceae TaxID=72275 RepID=UPI003D047A26